MVKKTVEKENLTGANLPDLPLDIVIYCPVCKKYQNFVSLKIDTDARFFFTMPCSHEVALELKVINSGEQVKENMMKAKP